MGAHMTSARHRNHAARAETDESETNQPNLIRIGIIKNAGKVKTVKRTQKQRRKKVKYKNKN